MLRSLFAGITGLRAHQTMLEVAGNNIANVNTTGFKASQTVFQDTLSQLLAGAGAPQGANGGTNPAQVGLGVKTAAIETNFAQGSAQNTGRSTDLMIDGDGFFVVHDNGQTLYTRAGSFSFDTNGRLVTPEGAVVQGWSANNGVINTNAMPGDIRLPIGTQLQPQATKNVTVGGNLPGDQTGGTPVVTTIDVYDAQGNKSTLTASFTKTSATSWDVTVSDGTSTSAPQAVNFKADGSNPTPAAVSFNGMTIDLSGITNFAGDKTVSATSQDGSGMGSLQSFSMSPDGTLVGVFSNGLKQPLGQIALANFNNPPGLEKVGDSLYRTTANSGTAQLGVAGTGGFGQLDSGMLEMSNVDLAQEFTNLIIAQRGFQANSRVITTSDQILQELVNLKQ